MAFKVLYMISASLWSMESKIGAQLAAVGTLSKPDEAGLLLLLALWQKEMKYRNGKLVKHCIIATVVTKHLTKSSFGGEGPVWFTVWSHVVHHGRKCIVITEMWEVGHKASEVRKQSTHRKWGQTIQPTSSCKAPPPTGSTTSQFSTSSWRPDDQIQGSMGGAFHLQTTADTKSRDTDAGLL